MTASTMRPNEVTSHTPLEPLLTVGDLARLLRVDPRTVRRLWEKGQLPKPLKVGGQNRWKEKDVAAAVERMRRQAGVSRAEAAE